MKTGGTMNFLKRAGAILMVVAIFASSCNKYADDFEQINTKLDALAMTVSGVTQLTTDMAALKSQVTALQTAVAALPTAAAQTAQFAAVKVETDKILAQIATITTTLGTVATTGTATKAVVDKLATDLAALTTKITADNAAMTAKLTALGTTDTEQSAQLTAIIAANAALLTKVTGIETGLAGLALTGTAADEATVLTIGGLQAMLDAQALMLEQILANTAMYVGDVSITNDAEVTFWTPKIKQLAMINGNLTINTTSITNVTGMNAITQVITAVIGTKAVNVTVSSAAKAVNLSKLGAIVGTFTATGGSGVAQSALDMSTLGNVSGDFSLDFDGAYGSAVLTAVGGNFTLVKKVVGTSPTRVGTTSIDFPNLAVTGYALDGLHPLAGTAPSALVYPLATKIALAGQFSKLDAVKAETIKINNAKWYASYASAVTDTVLTINAPSATLVDLSTTTVVGKTGTTGVMITTDDAATVDLSNFINYAPTSSTWTTIPVTITGPEVISLPKYVLGVLTSSTALEVTLAKHEWLNPATLPVVEKLTLGALNNALTMPSSVVEANITGKTQTVYTSCNATVDASGSNDLETLVLAGVIKSAWVTSTGLTTLTTSGVLNELEVDGCSELTAAGLGHTHFPSGPGSDLIINDNDKLTSLTTSTNYPRTLTITGNAELATINLASNTIPVTVSGAATWTIDGNKLTGGFVASKPSLGSDPFVEATITAPMYQPIKAMVAHAFKATADGGLGLNPATFVITIKLDLKDVDPSSTTVSLGAAMNANYLNYNVSTNPTVIDGDAVYSAASTKAGISSYKEVAIIQ